MKQGDTATPHEEMVRCSNCQGWDPKSSAKMLIAILSSRVSPAKSGSHYLFPLDSQVECRDHVGDNSYRFSEHIDTYPDVWPHSDQELVNAPATHSWVHQVEDQSLNTPHTIVSMHTCVPGKHCMFLTHLPPLFLLPLFSLLLPLLARPLKQQLFSSSIKCLVQHQVQ